MNGVDCFVTKATAEKNEPCSTNDSLINERFIYGSRKAVIGSRQTYARVNDDSLFWPPHHFAFSDEIIHPLVRSASVIFVLGSRENIRILNSLNSRLPTSIPIFKNDREVFVEAGNAADFSIPWPNPCALRSYVGIMGSFSILDGGCGLLVSGLRKLTVGLNELSTLLSGAFHFSQLTAESQPRQASKDDSQKNENQSSYADHAIYVLITIFATCLRFLSIAKGIDRGGYVGGCIIGLGLSLLAVGVCSFLCGFLNLSFP